LISKIHQGWLVALILFFCFTITVGILQYSFGVFVTPLENEFGWSRTEINGSVALFAISGITAPIVGPLLDKYGSRPIMIVSILLIAFSFLLRPLMTELWQYYALSVLSYAGMPGTVMLPVGKLIGVWFPNSRGRAMGFTTMGANFGGFIYSTATVPLIDSIGWESTYFVFGITFFFLIPLVYLFIRDEPIILNPIGTSNSVSPHLLGITTGDALRSKAFFFMIIGLLFASVAYQSVLTQVVPHLENIGISRGTAGAALGVIAIFGMLGKVLLGSLTEIVASRFVFIGSLIAQIVAMIIMISAGTSWYLWIFVPIYGLAFGGMGSLIPLIVQDTFGLKHFASIFGLVNFFILPAALIGPPLVGVSYDMTGGYSLAFLIICVGFIIGCIAFFLAKPIEEN
jgi:MFS family permease